jgi:predicted ATPase
VVIVLEDLHACDTASVCLAERLAAACPDALLLLTTRPLRADPDADASAAALARLQKAPRTLTLRLTPLRLEETAAMLQAGAGPDAPPLSPRLIAAVHDRTNGHPLFIEQVVKLLQQRKKLANDAELSGADLDSFLRSSSSIHAVVTQRIDALRPAAALTLKVAAVTGRTAAKLSLLTAIHPLHPSPRELALDLQELQRLEFLGGTDANDPDTVLFASTFVRDTAYELMATAQRRALHLAAAQALREPEIGGRDAAAGILWHLCQAAEGATLSSTERDELVAAWAAAGALASSRANHDEAARCFSSGAEAASAGSPEFVQLRTRAAEALAAAGRLPQAADAALVALHSIGLHVEASTETRKRSRRFQACLSLFCGSCSTTKVVQSVTYLQAGARTIALRAARVLAEAAAELPQSADARTWAEHERAARDAAR